MPVLGQIWPILGPKSNFWGERSKTFGTLISEIQYDTFFVLKSLIGEAPIGENVLFWPKKLDIWGEKSIFCMVIAIFVGRAYHKYTRGYNFPIWTTPPKKFIFEQWIFFQGSPLFFAVLGHSHFRGISTLNFGPFSTKLDGTVRAI